jgi:hypothetical protein
VGRSRKVEGRGIGLGVLGSDKGEDLKTRFLVLVELLFSQNMGTSSLVIENFF